MKFPSDLTYDGTIICEMSSQPKARNHIICEMKRNQAQTKHEPST